MCHVHPAPVSLPPLIPARLSSARRSPSRLAWQRRRIAQDEEFEPIDSSVCADCHEASAPRFGLRRRGLALGPRRRRVPRLPRRPRHGAPPRARRGLPRRLRGLPHLPRGRRRAVPGPRPSAARRVRGHAPLLGLPRLPRHPAFVGEPLDHPPHQPPGRPAASATRTWTSPPNTTS